MRVRVPPFAPTHTRHRRREAARSISFVSPQHRRDLIYSAILVGCTFIARLLCHGTVYFADGPSHIQAILAKTYVIQFPGYFLFNRIAGMFPDPVVAISAMNITCSVAGVVVFYFTARFFAESSRAFLAAVAYSAIFYAWYSAEVHSTYATQLLFPVAVFYLLLRYQRHRVRWHLWLAAAMFAAGAGMRPSDGVFLLPMVIYFLFAHLTRSQVLQFFSIFAALCLGWLIPTYLAMQRNDGGLIDTRQYVYRMLTVLSILHSVSINAVANVARYIVPLTAALWPVLGVSFSTAIRERADWRVRVLTLWVVPGSLFFMLVMITDPVYLNFLTPAVLLLALRAPRAMALTALWNFVLFVALSPIHSRSLPIDVADCYVLQYTRYGIEHQTALRLPEVLRARQP
jgi:4-amino-4-deoxy-L-arabinose transferase-like glycosyltransferase